MATTNVVIYSVVIVYEVSVHKEHVIQLFCREVNFHIFQHYIFLTAGHFNHFTSRGHSKVHDPGADNLNLKAVLKGI